MLGKSIVIVILFPLCFVHRAQCFRAFISSDETKKVRDGLTREAFRWRALLLAMDLGHLLVLHLQKVEVVAAEADLGTQYYCDKSIVIHFVS